LCFILNFLDSDEESEIEDTEDLMGEILVQKYKLEKVPEELERALPVLQPTGIAMH